MSRRLISPLLTAAVLAVCMVGCSKNEGSALDEVPALDEVQLQRTLSQGKYAFIEFGGRHCIPCRRMQPILAELAREHGTTITIANVFVQEQMKLGRQYRIRLIPTQVICDKDGKEIFRHTGFWEKSQILATWRELRIL